MVIYLITNQINGKQYIGQTVRDPELRWNEHNKYKINTTISNALKKYGIENFHFEVIDESASDIDELNDLEEFYISFYNTFKGRGYNMTSGGEGFTISEETKKKMSDSRRGVIKSNSHKKKISESHKGKTFSTESKQKMSESGKVKIFSKSHKQNISNAHKGKSGMLGHASKKVVQIDKITGKEIACWFSTNEVSKILNIQQSNISKCCNGKYKSAGGYIWRYL